MLDLKSFPFSSVLLHPHHSSVFLCLMQTEAIPVHIMIKMQVSSLVFSRSEPRGAGVTQLCLIGSRQASQMCSTTPELYPTFLAHIIPHILGLSALLLRVVNELGSHGELPCLSLLISSNGVALSITCGERMCCLEMLGSEAHLLQEKEKLFFLFNTE